MVTKNWVSAGMLGLVFCGALGPVFAQPQNTCTFEVRTRSRVGYRGFARYFIKGDWVREEKRSGGGLELIMVSNSKGLFIRNKHSNYWFKYPGGTHNHLKDRLLGGPTGDVPTFLKSVRAKKSGQEKLKKEMCSIYSYQFPQIKDRFRLWISDKTGKPLQLERDHLVPGVNKRDVLVIDYRSFECNTPIEDHVFQIAAKETIHDVSTTFSELQKSIRKPDEMRKSLTVMEKTMDEKHKKEAAAAEGKQATNPKK